MLTHLIIDHFTIIEHLELDFSTGMTVLTGETGAGKSIVIDALQYALGMRGDPDCIRHGADRSNISALFDVKNIPAAQAWLQEYALDNENQCLMRRTLMKDGRSKHFINGQPCTQQQMRELGQYLLNIHGQHENQTLVNHDTQLKLLDTFSLSHLSKKQNTAYREHLETLKKIHTEYLKKNREYQALQQKKNDPQHLAFLNYQCQELSELGCTEAEIRELEAEHQQLSHVDEVALICQQGLDKLRDNEHSILAQLHELKHNLQQSHLNDKEKITELLDAASIQLQETSHELQQHLQRAELNPERLQWIEHRLQKIYDLARKHHIRAYEIPALQERLTMELETTQGYEATLAAHQAALAELQARYQTQAIALSTLRQKSARQLAGDVSELMHQLGIPEGQFEVAWQSSEKFLPTGIDQIQFMVSANKGQSLKPLNKVASGGELSRISLAIQTLVAKYESTPSLIFDEVDTGIGGATAERVGQLLRQLAENSQVLCVTHLAQVAACAHQHLQVTKETIEQGTKTTVKILNQQERIEEIARMLGGLKITAHTRAHAKEMLLC